MLRRAPLFGIFALLVATQVAHATIVARLDGQGNVLDYMDWRDDTPLPANIRLATPTEIAALIPAAPTLINPGDFLARFTPTEQGCVQQAAITNAQIALGLTMGLARGAIDLKGPLLAPWMAALVSAGCLTSQRATAITTP